MVRELRKVKPEKMQKSNDFATTTLRAAAVLKLMQPQTIQPNTSASNASINNSFGKLMSKHTHTPLLLHEAGH